MIFVTGTGGFIGNALVSAILDQGLGVQALVRNIFYVCPDGSELIVGDCNCVFQ